MKIVCLRDTVFSAVGKPVIVCKASVLAQPAPDWITCTSAWQLGVSCGALSIPTSVTLPVPATQNLVAASVDTTAINEAGADQQVEETHEDSAPKKRAGK